MAYSLTFGPFCTKANGIWQRNEGFVAGEIAAPLPESVGSLYWVTSAYATMTTITSENMSILK